MIDKIFLVTGLFGEFCPLPSKLEVLELPMVPTDLESLGSWELKMMGKSEGLRKFAADQENKV